MARSATYRKDIDLSKPMKLGDIYAQAAHRQNGVASWKAIVRANFIRLGIVGLGSAMFLLLA